MAALLRMFSTFPNPSAPPYGSSPANPTFDTSSENGPHRLPSIKHAATTASPIRTFVFSPLGCRLRV